jgi:hypothetical protein
MKTLKNNPALNRMFQKLVGKTTEQLKEAFTTLDLLPASSETSLTKAIIFEEIEERIGKEEAGQWIDGLDFSDDLNPKYIFTCTFTALLAKAANDEIDLKELAIAELRNRGLDNNGKFIGFNK